MNSALAVYHAPLKLACAVWHAIRYIWIAGRVHPSEYSDPRICSCGKVKPVEEWRCFDCYADDQI